MARVRFLRPALCALALAACDSGIGPEPDLDSVAAVRVEAPAPRLWAGKTMQLSVRVLAASGDSLPGRTVRWSSSDSMVAKVSDAGLVTGRTPGAVTITASSEGKSASVALDVVEPIQYCYVQNISSAIALGTTRQLRAIPLAPKLRELPNRSVTWRSSDPTVLAVDSTGLITARSLGIATITASCEGVESSTATRVDSGYTLTPLGTPAGSSSHARDLNHRGEVVGEIQGLLGERRAVLWRDGRIIELGVPGSRSMASGISENGLVIGSFTSATGETGYRPFLWRDGTVTQLDPAATEENVFATGVNGTGTVVGYSATVTAGGTVGSALSWSGGQRKDWGRMDGNNARFVRVNDAGQMLGVVCATSCSSFLLSGTQRTALPDRATGLSDNGWVSAADARTEDPVLGRGGYVWKDGRASYRYAGRRAWLDLLDVNGSGHAVGAYSNHFAQTFYAFLWRAGVETRLDEVLVDAPGWTLIAATGINDRGQIIAIGRRSDSDATVAVLLTPRQ